jgi:RNA polymerase sigma factor (sigma-70 family)
VGTVLGDAFDPVLRAAQQGSAWAFERLWADLGPVVAGYLRAQGAADPDDLASETFIGVFTGIRGYEGDERHFRSWVLVIAHRRLIDERRRAGRRVPERLAGDDLPEVRTAMGADDDALTALGTERVLSLLSCLSEDQRTVLTLRVVADLTIEQTAAVVGKRPGAVKALQRRGLAQLRKAVSVEGVSVEGASVEGVSEEGVPL